jgi:hypothetical protein
MRIEAKVNVHTESELSVMASQSRNTAYFLACLTALSLCTGCELLDNGKLQYSLVSSEGGLYRINKGTGELHRVTGTRLVSVVAQPDSIVALPLLFPTVTQLGGADSIGVTAKWYENNLQARLTFWPAEAKDTHTYNLTFEDWGGFRILGKTSVGNFTNTVDEDGKMVSAYSIPCSYAQFKLIKTWKMTYREK